MMCKVVKIWQSVNSRQIAKMKEEFAFSIGIHKLVSEDDDYLMDLALAEIIENLMSVGKSVALLGKKCADPTYHNLEAVFEDPSTIDPKWCGWQYRLKKMDKKVKKMEKFVATTEQLYSELEALAELETSLKRMKAGAKLGKMKLFEFEQKVSWQRQEVRSLQEMSPWVRTHDYIVRLLLRSLFTIIEKIKFAFGIGKVEGSSNWFHQNRAAGLLSRSSSSMSGLVQRCGYSSESNESGGCKRRTSSSFACTSIVKNRRSYDKSPSSILCVKQHQMLSRRFASIGLSGCITGGIESPFVETYTNSGGSSFRSCAESEKDGNEMEDRCSIPIKLGKRTASERSSFFQSKLCLLNASPSTLGYTALAHHYANVIILMEKIASSPHSISLDARDDLYDMLPSTIRSRLREKLKTFSTTPALSDYNPDLAAEWSSTIEEIFEWLSPLARNMLRWQSERNFERQRSVCASNILLVQTLHFANQAETEAAIVELLVGLSYLFRCGKVTNEKPFCECSGSRAYDGHVYPRYSMYYDMIDHI